MHATCMLHTCPYLLNGGRPLDTALFASTGAQSGPAYICRRCFSVTVWRKMDLGCKYSTGGLALKPSQKLSTRPNRSEKPLASKQASKKRASYAIFMVGLRDAPEASKRAPDSGGGPMSSGKVAQPYGVQVLLSMLE
ncbi:hypothetical protein TgHK011_003774 [Trichoderma gracile]|nr:hypothetical protein TgHK011_003774 [Trichoderma gracile]